MGFNACIFKFKNFIIYNLISLGIAGIGTFFMNILYLKHVFILLPLVFIFIVFLYLLMARAFLKSKYSVFFVAIFSIVYYELFFLKWLTRPSKNGGIDDLGLGILILFYNIFYLISILIASILAVIISKKKFKCI